MSDRDSLFACSHPSTVVDRVPPSWSREPYPAILTETCDECGATIKTTLVKRPAVVERVDV